MLFLTSTADVIQLVTGSTATVHCHASWVDNNSGVMTYGRLNTPAISTATTTTVIAAPASGVSRNVKHLTINNVHATQSIAVVIQHYDGVNTERLWDGTLLAGESVDFTEAGKWNYYSAGGVLLSRYTTPLTAKGDLLTFDNSLSYPGRRAVGSVGRFLSSLPSDKTGMSWNRPVPFSSAVANQTGFASNTALTGSSITTSVGGPPAVGAVYCCTFDMTKTAAGPAAISINVMYGTTGTVVSDFSILTFTFGAGTAFGDVGTFEVLLVFRAVGAAASVAGIATCRHQAGAAGLVNTGTSALAIVTAVNTFDGTYFASTVAPIITLAFNGGASFSGTLTNLQTYGIGLST